MGKIGLRLLSTEYDKYHAEAQELFAKHIFDYVELYIMPDTTDMIEKWKQLEVKTPNGNNIKIPYMLHAPGYKYGVNLSNPANLEINKKYFAQVELYRQSLNSKCTIVSAGEGGHIGESIRQLKVISPKNILIKNNTYKTGDLNSTNGVGSTAEEVSKIKKELMCGFCLDIGNAVCSANYQNKEPYGYIREFNLLNPLIYRISGNKITNKINEHGNLEDATYDYSILSLIIRNNAIITINSEHHNDNLTDFKNNVLFLKRYCK